MPTQVSQDPADACPGQPCPPRSLSCQEPPGTGSLPCLWPALQSPRPAPCFLTPPHTEAGPTLSGLGQGPAVRGSLGLAGVHPQDVPALSDWASSTGPDCRRPQLLWEREGFGNADQKGTSQCVCVVCMVSDMCVYMCVVSVSVYLCVWYIYIHTHIYSVCVCVYVHLCMGSCVHTCMCTGGVVGHMFENSCLSMSSVVTDE